MNQPIAMLASRLFLVYSRWDKREKSAVSVSLRVDSVAVVLRLLEASNEPVLPCT